MLQGFEWVKMNYYFVIFDTFITLEVNKTVIFVLNIDTVTVYTEIQEVTDDIFLNTRLKVKNYVR